MGKKTATDFPYEKQADTLSNRMSGAAALCMVYRSLGLAGVQAEVWAKVARPDAQGYLTIRPHALAADAVARGLKAVAFQARVPLQVLKRSHEQGIRVVLHHCLNLGTPVGHYTVPIEWSDPHVVMHDPVNGPGLRVLQSDLLKLWQPPPGTADITGNVLVAIGKQPSAPAPCPTCQATMPTTVACPACQQAIPLQPAVALGCANPRCAGRNWERIYCPHCGDSWTGTAADVRQPVVRTVRPLDPDLASMDPALFEAKIEEVCVLLAAIPAVSEIADMLRSNLQEYKGLYAAEVKEFQATPDPRAAVPPAEAPVVPAAKPPPEPINGNKLGQQMAREFGFLPPEAPPAVARKPAQPPAAKPKTMAPPRKVKQLPPPEEGDDFGTLKVPPK